jgi:hypothetical protein
LLSRTRQPLRRVGDVQETPRQKGRRHQGRVEGRPVANRLVGWHAEGP